MAIIHSNNFGLEDLPEIQCKPYRVIQTCCFIVDLKNVYIDNKLVGSLVGFEDDKM